MTGHDEARGFVYGDMDAVMRFHAAKGVRKIYLS